MKKKRVLLIYTGGTFGMDVQIDLQGHSRRVLATPNLQPQTLSRQLRARVPELDDIAHCDVEIVLNRDSAHIGPAEWRLLAERIQKLWRGYDGVVLLHGTDTMSYTASALSFLLRPCVRPVVLTGAQRPLSALRTDARRNLISAVEIAAHGPRGQVSQVSVFFDNQLLQGNRVRKRSASEFRAFESPQAPPLAVVGTEIRYAGRPAKLRAKAVNLPKLLPDFSAGVVLMHATPGFPARTVREQLLPRLAGLILVIFPSGTAPTNDPEFVQLLREAKRRGTPIVATVEGIAEGASEGSAHTDLANYAAGSALLTEGVYWAGAMTPECAYVKTSWLLGQPGGTRRFAELWKRNFAQET